MCLRGICCGASGLLLLGLAMLAGPSGALPTQFPLIFALATLFSLPVAAFPSVNPHKLTMKHFPPNQPSNDKTWTLYAFSSDAMRVQAYQNYREDPAEVEDSMVRHLDSLGGGHLLRNLDGLGGGHLLRQTRGGLDSLSGITFGGNKRLDSLSGITFGNQKRNFDEIDRSGFNSFVKKNFDEIDRSGFDSFVKKNFDEIDRVGFGSFVKRNAPALIARYYEKDNH